MKRNFSLATINEAIAAAIPDRDAIVSRRRHLTWRELASRTRRLANLLASARLGCHRERSALEPWESGQDHLALYLYNGNEYLEGMLGAYKARVAPFNVNYRYVEEELFYVLNDAKTRAIVYHASFAPLLARVLTRLPNVALLLQVADESGEPLLPGALDYEEALRETIDEPSEQRSSEEDLYVLYTGGTTGMPKGVLWKQVDIFFAALGGRMPGMGAVASVEELVERAKYGEGLRVLPAPPFMHGAAHWTAFIMLHQGGTVVLQDDVRRFDAKDVLATIERERVTSLSIVGDAFARPLLDELRAAKYDLASLQVLGSGGAIFSPTLKKQILELVPHLLIYDGFGSSETGAQGSTLTTAGMDIPKATFRMDEHTCVLDESLRRRLEPGEKAVGWVARTGHVPLGYLGDPGKTRKTYPVIDGTRYAVPGDRAEVAADGTIVVFGRDSVCINSGGEKIFAEEVEQALKHHPAVYDVVVTGTPSERWGEQVTAVVALRPGAKPTDDELREAAGSDVARYKLPKAFVYVDAIIRAPSGKPDYRWAKETATAALATTNDV